MYVSVRYYKLITVRCLFQYSKDKDQEYFDAELDGGLKDAEGEEEADDADKENDEGGTDSSQRLSSQTLAGLIHSPRSPGSFSSKVHESSTPYQVRGYCVGTYSAFRCSCVLVGLMAFTSMIIVQVQTGRLSPKQPAGSEARGRLSPKQPAGSDEAPGRLSPKQPAGSDEAPGRLSPKQLRRSEAPLRPNCVRAFYGRMSKEEKLAALRRMNSE